MYIFSEEKEMKKLIITLVAICFASVALAGNLEFQAKNVGNPGVWKYTATVGFGEQLSPKFGWTGFVLSSNTWGEAYVGPTFTPASWITVATCVGIQNDPQVTRFASWYSLNYGQFSAFHVMESGSGTWHKILISYKTSFGKVQFWNQTALGSGPRVEVKLPGQKTMMSAYAGVMFDGKVTNHAVGVIKSF
ncbi:MAG: hypothetical protein Q8O32_00225 [bacterium]|nr:hypothetical protein [bacterium]